jgi:hypothetical protein
LKNTLEKLDYKIEIYEIIFLTERKIWKESDEYERQG